MTIRYNASAAIDPDINTWDAETLQRASDVLDKAQQAKFERLNFGKAV